MLYLGLEIIYCKSRFSVGELYLDSEGLDTYPGSEIRYCKFRFGDLILDI